MMSVSELKELLKDWPEYDYNGEESEVWVIDNSTSLSNEVKRSCVLNRTDLALIIK